MLVPIAPGLALSVVIAVVLIATLPTRLWQMTTFLMLSGLVILSSGFNNIPIPLGGIDVPLVTLLFVYALVASWPHWRDIVNMPIGRWLLALLVLLTAVASARLIFDIRRYGIVAGRDALYVLEAWGVLVGYGLVRSWGSERMQHALSWLWRTAVLWFLFFPARDALAEWGPDVGIQYPTPLLTFTSSGFVAATVLFWFLQESRFLSAAFAVLALLVVLMAQTRAMYLAIPFACLTILISSWLTRRAKRGNLSHVLPRLIIFVIFTLVVLASVPPLPGRVGEDVGVDAVAAQLQTLTGAEGPGAGSFAHRARAWPSLVAEVRDAPAGPIGGLGYGPDLFDGFTTPSGALVRKPHNDPLEIWARTGFVGVLPWLALLSTLLLWTLHIAPRHPRGWWLIALHVTAFASALTQPFFAFAFGGLVYMILAGVGLGMAHSSSLKNASIASGDGRSFLEKS